MIELELDIHRLNGRADGTLKAYYQGKPLDRLTANWNSEKARAKAAKGLAEKAGDPELADKIDRLILNELDRLEDEQRERDEDLKAKVAADDVMEGAGSETLRTIFPHPTTDIGAAEFTLKLHGSLFTYCPTWRKWLAFRKSHWQVDHEGITDRAVKDAMRKLKREAAKLKDDPRAPALFKFGQRCEGNRKIKDIIERMSRERGVCTMPDAFDRDPWLLNVANGTLDLQAAELRPHCRGDFITKLAPVVYDPSATCPVFLQFLDSTFASNGNLIRFVQRVVGYSLTGITTERILLILHGSGRNGKSTLLGILRALLGDYSIQTPSDTLLQRRNDGIPNDIARLKGIRLASASENDEGRRLDESKVKQMTGGEDALSARFLYSEFFDFQPQFKLWLATNHKPEVRGTDPAIWDRIRLIPFNVRFDDDAEDERLRVDRSLPEKLRGELSGILTWAVQGCLDWQAEGLDTPPEVQMATNAYRLDSDRLGDFVTECCETDAALS